jgi:hypothetical protein
MSPKNIVDNILTSLGSNDKVFTCYSGYKIVDHWTTTGGNYRQKPVIQKTVNILTETDPYTKIEHKFDDLPEIFNEHPVNDIARWKNNYYVAHQNNIYIYQSHNAYITSLKLLPTPTGHLNCNLAAGDIIKKIFIHKDDNVIAISSKGSIVKNSSIVSSSFPANETLYSMAYNAQNNMVLLGGRNFVQIVLLNNPHKTFLLDTNNLRINTIDTNNHYILLSNIVQNPDIKKTWDNKGHRDKQQDCCRKKIPYNQWQECGNCKDAKQAWENEPITLNLNVTIERNNIPDLIKQLLTYTTPYPGQCDHRIPPVPQDNLIDSCKQNTFLLLSLSELIEATSSETDSSNLDLSQFIKHCIEHRNEYSDPGDDEKMSILTHALLTDDFLFIGENDNKEVSHYKPQNNFIYKIPLNSPEQTDIQATFDNRIKNKNTLLYDAQRGDTSSQFLNDDTGLIIQLQIQKNQENGDKIMIVKICPDCSRWCQVSFPCCNKKNWRQKVYDTILFTKNDGINNQQPYYVTKLLKRKLCIFKRALFATFTNPCILFVLLFQLPLTVVFCYLILCKNPIEIPTYYGRIIIS